MARAFSNPLDSSNPMQPPRANTPISYVANVNRQKTKKWANAAPADYGGDDWGDEDEYDPPPPPISKPTGLRQQGQGITTGQKPDSLGGDSGKKPYGALPPLPSSGAINSGRARTNSFDAEDEKRNFSSSTVRQQSPPAVAINTTSGPATRFSQMGVPSPRDPSTLPALSIATQSPPQAPTGLRKASQTAAVPTTSPIIESPNLDMVKPGRTNTGNSDSAYSPSDTRGSIDQARRTNTIDSGSIYSQASPDQTPSDYQGRRDFSPSAVPSPLQAGRASPSPQSATETSSNKFTPRKSSLSHSSRPDSAEITQPPEAAPKSWTTTPGRTGSPAASGTPAPTGKALPFIRPADIYRRAEEERKERESMDSSRPSMDSLPDVRSNDAKPENTTSENPGQGTRRRTSFEGDEFPDSGHRLMPILEPVRERKSEYSLEGFDAKTLPSDTIDAADVLNFQESAQLNAEHTRSHSTSPKLPDLNRMSGFGMDLFSSPISHPPALPIQDAERTPRPPSTAQMGPEQSEDPTLRNQPSLGFKSVVNQAFDRSRDPSIPDTPASNPGSDIRRTDSESTGTTGISPIMSRYPSSAVSDNRNRDVSTPSILEVVHEPVSSDPETGAQVTHPLSTDASNEEITPKFPVLKLGHRRDISTPSPGNSPARIPNLAENEQIPKGEETVVSRASSNSSTMVGTTEEPLQPPRPITEREQSFRPSLPGGWASYATTETEKPTQLESHSPLLQPETSPHTAQVGNYDGDITPTTSRHSLPQSSSGAAASTSIGGLAGTILGIHDSKEDSSPTEGPQNIRNNNLPTPDPAMAPGGNVYSTKVLDRRLLPKLEQSPAEVQLRPDFIDRTIIADSSVAPTPLPKDTPPLGSDSKNSPFQQARHVTADEQQSERAATASIQTLNVENDDQNEKLRLEIVRSLSPRTSEVGSHQDEIPADQARESTYLPSEYDNYWASTTDDAPAPVKEVSNEPKVPSITTEFQGGPEDVTIAPLSPRRPQLQKRFSWEQSSENVSVSQALDDSTLSTDISARDASSTVQSQVSEPAQQLSPLVESQNLDSDSAKEIVQNSAKRIPSDEQVTRDAAVLAGSSALGTAAAATDIHSQETPSYSQEQPSLLEEKNLASTASITTPSKRPFSATTKLMPFKEIAAIKSTAQRIQTYDETRHRFATMDSGLADWIARLQADHEEYANATGSYGASRPSVPTLSARSKFSAKLTGGVPPPSQQPYYQQYLNASSPTNTSPPISRPGQGMTTGSQQGFSLAGNKVTTQQVQAKGKELLHSAGIFGGKAGKAGKGLLAKGKNKLRERGIGGDKTSPPHKPKLESRSSWGPLGLSRSQGGIDTSRASMDSHPSLRYDALRSATLTSEVYNPPLLFTPTIDSLEATSKEEVTSEEPQENESVLSLPPQGQPEEADKDDEDEALADIGKPAPIGKTQPSWDPSTATPIAEEEPSHNEHPQQNISRSITTPKPDSGPAQSNIGSKSNCSDSVDVFYDTPEDREEPTDLNDWVVVNPESKSKKELELSDKPKARLEIRKLIHIGHMSILDRPRYTYDPAGTTSPSSTGIRSVPSKATPAAVFPASEARIVEQVKNEEPTRHPSFKGLPPIRRTSTFGLGFGRQTKTRFPIEDDDEDVSPIESENDTDSKNEYGNDHNQDHHLNNRRALPTLQTQFGENRPDSEVLANTPTRPGIRQMRLSEYNQYPVPPIPPQHASDIPTDIPSVPDHLAGDIRRSNEAWRQNANHSPFHTPSSTWSETGVPPKRQSFEPQRARAGSNSSQTYTHRSDPMNDHFPRPGAQPVPFAQPPSAAQRYPELFRPTPQSPDIPPDGADLPDNHYQPPIPKEQAFLPRQQTNEYEIPGVGPDDRPAGSRRNSGFFRDLGGKLSRASSRERSMSGSQGGGISPSRRLDSAGNGYAGSNVTSEDGQEKKRRGSGLYKHARASTGTMAPPYSQESVVGHHPGSRIDLAIVSPPLAPEERKRFLFPNLSIDPRFDPRSIPKKLSRASTSNVGNDYGKRPRFGSLGGSLSGLFNRSNQTPLETSYEERPQIDSEVSSGVSSGERPTPGSRPQQRNPIKHGSVLNPKNMQSRDVFKKLVPGSGAADQPRRDSRTRRPSAAGLLNSFMGRRSQQLERESSNSHSQKSESPHPRPLPPARTYSDLQEEPATKQPNPIVWKPTFDQNPDRGRRQSREPQYDSVPIPGGYSLVRGEGATAVHTDYDPRGLNRFQNEPRPVRREVLQNGILKTPNSISLTQPQQPESHQLRAEPPPLKNLSINEAYRTHQRKLSAEDLIARSPARESPTQQRPYQLTLPEDDDEPPATKRRPSSRKEKDIEASYSPLVSPMSKQLSPPLDKGLRDTHPLLRHPESPSSYPLPDSSTLSPINPKAKDLPPPPPPKYSPQPQRQRHIPIRIPYQSPNDPTPNPQPRSNPHISNRYLSIEPHLDRSNTHNTAVSALSDTSASPSISPSTDPTPNGLASSPKNQLLENGIPKGNVENLRNHTITPPSRQITPEISNTRHPKLNPINRDPDRIKTTVLKLPEQGLQEEKEDLYDASPRISPSQTQTKTHPSQSQPQSSIPQPSSSTASGESTQSKNLTEDLKTVKEVRRNTKERETLNGAHKEVRPRDPEEKIFYDRERGEDAAAEEEEVMMVATSYPGQEWNPYAGGGWEDFE
ncbi:hypothetical protein B7494_g4365 [Chlorociboria aeruginascens]|nr:hypothetical protein B7494_g4365 [Chlorociboria aeruginascens]